MASKTDIINLALAVLGEPKLSSPTEETKANTVANVCYELARDKTLRDHPWNFALKRQELAQVPASVPVFEFTFAYQLPADCLRLLYTEDHWFNRQSGNYWPYKVVGRNVETDLESCKVMYIRKVTEEGYFDSTFVIAFSMYLAYLMSMSMTEHRNQTEGLLAQYKLELSEARFSDAQEGTSDQVEEGSWIESRA